VENSWSGCSAFDVPGIRSPSIRSGGVSVRIEQIECADVPLLHPCILSQTNFASESHFPEFRTSFSGKAGLQPGFRLSSNLCFYEFIETNYVPKMTLPVQTLIVDDSHRSRAGLRALLTTSPDIEVIAEACSGGEAVEQVEKHLPDVVLMDVRMPGMDGLTAARYIKKKWPQIRVVLLTMYDTYREEAQAAGAEAYLIKGCSLDEILQALVPGYTQNSNVVV
jgi:CheY-like chemotaxis protein